MMATGSKIEWTHHTFNPWRGCTKISAGCANCYAETMSHRNPKSLGVWGDNGVRAMAAESYWKLPMQWNRRAAAAGERHRVFCASLADVCEDRGDVIESRLRLKQTILDTPHLDWLLLTKRPENYLRLFWGPEWWPSNVWAGTSIENQEAADERMPRLLRVPASVRFLSVEPLLGPVDLKWLRIGTCNKCGHAGECAWMPTGLHHYRQNGTQCNYGAAPIRSVNWVIVGGESGHGARPMHPDWARSIRDQCKAAGVPFFFKQWGELGAGCVNMETGQSVFRHFATKEQWINKASSWVNGGICVDKTGRILNVGADFDSAMYPVTIMHRVGKKAAGRLLDGVEHNEFPKAMVTALTSTPSK